MFITEVLKGNLQTAATILEHSPALVNSEDDVGYTALHHCATDNLVTEAAFLLSHGANTEAASNEYRRTALHIAVQKGHRELVELLIQHRASLDSRERSGNTPLHVAAICRNNGDCTIAKFLIAAGADINALSNNNKTPIMHAITERWLEIAQLLIAHGADLAVAELNKGYTALHLAAAVDCPDIITMLVEAGMDIEIKDIKGTTSLGLAASKGHVASVAKLLRLGADLHATDDDGFEPIHLAACNGDIQVMSYLLNNGADLEARTAVGLTPLHCAILQSQTDSVDYLLQTGADIYAVTSDGYTTADALSLCRQNQAEIAELLNAAMRAAE